MLPHTFFVYRLKYLFDEFSIHATQCALRAAFLEDFVVASGLQDGHVMLFFVCTDFTCHTHPFGQLLNKIVVAFVYLLAQFAEVLGALCFLADDQQVEDVIQHIRVTCWAASLQAQSGLQWLSIISPLKPKSIACWQSGATSSRFPPMWLGSQIIGRLGIRRRSSMGICHWGKLR